MTDIVTPQAGWYPDPTDSRAYRWWSGGAWTDHLTAAPGVGSAWAEASGPDHPMAASADAFTLVDEGSDPFSSRFEEPWQNAVRPVERNRAGLVVVIIGMLSVAGYLASMAVGFSTIIPLIPGILGLIVAVPAFRRARITGDGLAVSLLGVLLAGAGAILSVLPLLPMLLGLPSTADISGTTRLITSATGFHSTIERALVGDAQKDFNQIATSASCPTAALPESGSTFTCTVALTDGSTQAVNVTVTDDAGHFTSLPATS